MPALAATVPVPPPEIVNHPAAVDAWYAGLSPVQRGLYLEHLRNIIESMGPRRRRVFQKVLDRMTGSVVPGLGTWGALVGGLTSAVLQVGSSVYLSKEQADLQKDLSSESADLQKELARLQLQAEADAQKALISAQTEAARVAAEAQLKAAQIAAESTVGKAQIEAQRDVMRTQYRTQLWSNPYLLGAVGVGGAAVLIIVLRARKKRRSR